MLGFIRRKYKPIIGTLAVFLSVVAVVLLAIFCGEDCIKILGIMLLSSFMPLSIFSFYGFRLKRKRHEYKKIIEALELGKTGADLSLPTIKTEYNAMDYVLPVTFVTLICLMGFTVINYGYSEKLFSLKEHYLILSGTHFSVPLSFGAADKKTAENALVTFQQTSLLALTMAFLGSYVWAVQNIFRRMVTIDLPPSTYYTIAIRMILASFVALMVRFAITLLPYAQSETIKLLPVIAFLTGMFPERMLHYLKERLKIFSNKQKAPDLPLEMLEGMNIFHKIRLGEIGIDNAQNLAEANLVELIVRTPFPPKEIIDWIGQAKLFLYFKNEIVRLRKVGIRSIYDFKNLKDDENQFAEISKNTQINEMHIKLIYQMVQKDSAIKRLSEAANILNVV